MRVHRIASVVLVLLLASAAHAQIARAFVSAQHGDDLNNCLPTTPCRTFGRAITQTAAGGEIIVLDSGGYGPFTITQSVQVQAPAGVYAGITASTGTAVTVTAPSAVVRLKGLSLNSTGADYGIDVSDATSLYADDDVATGFNTAGLRFYSAGGQLFVSGGAYRRSNQFLSSGITVSSAQAEINNVALEEDFNGILAANASKVTASHCVASGNTNGYASRFAGAELTIEGSVSSNNATAGVFTADGGLARVSTSTITNNSVGFDNAASAVAGLIATRGNNTLEGNATPTVGAIASITGH